MFTVENYQKAIKVNKIVSNKHTKKTLGFTLIEVLITVAILGILAAIVYPSYISFINKSNRTEGQRELMRLANLQEQYFIDNRTYANHLKKLGESNQSITSQSGHYKINVQSSNANSFVIEAIAQGRQLKNDIHCTALTINHLGQKRWSSSVFDSKVKCWD
jgi:type IV pilus assembly protein PilE